MLLTGVLALVLHAADIAPPSKQQPRGDIPFYWCNGPKGTNHPDCDYYDDKPKKRPRIAPPKRARD